MAFPTKIQIPVAANSRSNFTLTIPHVTTSNFMEFGVSLARELVPKQEVDIKHECFSRLEPLVLPTFGEASFKHRAFYVPFRTVYPAFTDMMEGTPHVYNNGTSAIPTSTPVLYESDITHMFVDGGSEPFCVRLSQADSANPDVKFDFSVTSPSSTEVEKYNLTPIGRRIYKLFVSLGMKFTFSYTSSGFVSALPLFCAARVYLDWFFTSQYAHTSGYTAIQKFLIRNDDIVDVGESFVPTDDLALICETLSTIFYEPDYFVSAWDKPTGPNQGLQSTITIPDINTIDNQNRLVVTSADTNLYSSEPHIKTQGGAILATLSSYMLTSVKKLGDYLKRNQLVGARAIDRFYARFGIQLPAEAMDRSYLISEYSQVVKFGDVTSLASTESATLGDYAGKGISFGDGSFKYTATERGYLIIITTVVPKTYYYQGVDRMALHTSPLDFFVPEFDALGVQAIASQEVYKPIDENQHSNWTDNYDRQVFGFVPRYGEYKKADAIISGDYILRSRNVGKDAWTLFRDVSPAEGDTMQDVIHDLAFTTSSDANQYNRIFYNTSDNVDHFNIVHNFVINTSFPGKSLYDTYEFDDEDKSQKVTVGLGGTNLS